VVDEDASAVAAGPGLQGDGSKVQNILRADDVEALISAP